MTRPEHLREHLRATFGEEHLRTSGAPTPDQRTAGQSTYGSTYGTYAPEHLRTPPLLDRGGGRLGPVGDCLRTKPTPPPRRPPTTNKQGAR